jgi:hypothetical protein
LPTTSRHRLTAIAVVVGAALAIPSIGQALGWTGSDDATSTSSTSGTDPTSAPTTATPATTTAPTAPTRRPSATAAPRPAASARPGTALSAVATLAVKGRAPKTGYDRALYGQAWLDTDRNGCDTRNDVLRRDLRALVLKAGTHGCVVLRGTLADPYTGRSIAFVRGQSTSSLVQVDHVVALSDSWQKGAQGWSGATRAAFANDPLNLLAVDGPTNQSKGDGDTATWLPPDKAYRCSYVARQVAVKVKYRVWATPAERDAMVRVLSTCPAQTLPVAGRFVLGGGREEATSPTPTTAPRAAAPAPLVGSTDPRFDTCKAAKAAGYGPYRSGVDPEYDWYRDADSDGIVCE